MNDEDLSRLDREYDPRPLNSNQAAAIRLLQLQAKTLARYTLGHLPTSREQRLALQHLEQFVFWGRAAVERHP